MTIPFTPSGGVSSPVVTAFEGLISGAAFSALTNRTETSVRAAIKADIIANDTWGSLWDVFLGLIRLPLDWIVDILKKLFPWIAWANIPSDFNAILTWINNSLSAIPFFGTFIQGAETFIQALLRNVIEFFTNPGTGLLNALKALFGTAGGLIDTVISSIVYWLSNPGALLTGLIAALKTLFGNAGALIGTVIDSLIYFITHPGQPGGIGYLLLEAFKTLFGNAGGLIGTVISSVVYWLTHPGDLLTGIISAAKTWISNGGELFATLLATVTGWITGGFQTIEAFFGSLWGGTSSLLKGLMENIITSILGPNAVLEWNSLTNWASGLLNVGNILQAIKDAIWNLTHLFPVIDTTATEVNLILQGSFKTASTLSAASGWAWDSTTNNTAGGSVGGAGVGGTAKVTAAGAARYLYCNQVIPVVAGDSLTFSAWVKTGSLTRSGSTTPLSLLIFPDAATTGTAVTASAAWPLAPTTFTKIAGTYTVPAGVTTVRVGIGITAAALTGSVWFDDVFLGATRTLKQPLVRDLTKAFGGVKDALGRNPRGTNPTATFDYDSFYDTTTATTGLIGTASSDAALAKGDTQKVVDGLSSTVGGSGATGSAASTATYFGSFFTKLYGAGNTTPQATVPQGSITSLTSSFGGIKDAFNRSPRNTTPNTTFDYNSLYDATTATAGLIGTIGSTASGAASDLQTTWNNLWDSFNGSTGSLNKTADNVKTAASANQSKTDGTVNNFVNGYRGWSGTRTIEETEGAAAAISAAAAAMNSQIADLQSAAGAGTFSGNAAVVNFTTAANNTASLGASWSQTYPAGTGDIPLNIVSGKAGMASAAKGGSGSTVSSRKAVAVYTTTKTLTDYQKVSMVMSGSPDANTANYVFGRMNAAGTQYVYAKVIPNTIQYNISIGYNAGGGEVLLNSFIAPVTAGTNVSLVVGINAASQRSFQLYLDGSAYGSAVTDGGAASVMGENNLYAGIGMVSYSVGSLAAKVASFSLQDNVPPTYKGSGFRAAKYNTTALSVAVNAGAILATDNFFSTAGGNSYQTTDYTFSGTGNKLTVNRDGWYQVNITIGGSGTNTGGGGNTGLVLFKNGTAASNIVAKGSITPFVGNTTAGGIVLNTVLYLKAADYLHPGTHSTFVHSTLLTGDTAGVLTHWTVTHLNNTMPS